MANGNYASIEKQIQELSKRHEDFERRVVAQSETRSAEIGALREAMSGSISAADRDAATVEALATRLGEAENRLNRPPAPVNWTAIIGLVVTSAIAVSSLGNWALINLEKQILADRAVIRGGNVRIEKLQSAATRAITIQESNTREILDLRARLQVLEAQLAQATERVRQTESRVSDIDRIGPRHRE